jgi:hypothetical protein
LDKVDGSGASKDAPGGGGNDAGGPTVTRATGSRSGVERHRSQDDGVWVQNKAGGHEMIRGRERLRREARRRKATCLLWRAMGCMLEPKIVPRCE